MDRNVGMLAGRVDVTVRFHEDDHAGIGDSYSVPSHDFTIAGVGHVRFNPVVVIALIGVDLGGQRHMQHAIRIQLPGALADLLPKIIPVIISFAVVAFIRIVAPKNSPVRELIAGAEDGVLHFAVRDRSAKIIAGSDGALN